MITQQVSEILRIEIEDGDLYPGTKYLLIQNWRNVWCSEANRENSHRSLGQRRIC